MPIIPGLTTSILAGQPYYRITSRMLWARRARDHKKIVDGSGAIKHPHGGRYNHPGVRTVYLAEDPATCFAEKLYYFHREVLTGLDSHHITGRFPTFQESSILWEVLFRNDIHDVFDLSLANAAALGVYPTLMLNPSQDYHHLTDRCAKRVKSFTVRSRDGNLPAHPARVL